MPAVHPAAATGFAQAAATYANGRPDYPPGLEDWLRNTIALGPGKTVLDLGAGTGKFVPVLRSTGATLIAVEPVAAMRAQLAAAHPDVALYAGTAQAIPLPDASVDAVTCAQAFHWFATDAALAEIARVLKPGGVLALVWNVRDTRHDWVLRLSEIIDAHEDDAPRYRSGAWRKRFPNPAFSELPEQCWPYTHKGAAETVIVNRSLSISFIAALPAAARATVANDIRALIAATPELARDPVSVPYITRGFTFQKPFASDRPSA